MTHPIDTLNSLDSMEKDWEVRSFPNAMPLSPSAKIYCNGKVTVQPFLTYDGSIFLDEGSFIGPYVFMRGPIYVGKNSSIGPYSEIKRSYIMNNVAIAHRNIIPDSVLGENAWFAGGVMITNLRIDKKPIKVTWDGVEKVGDRFGIFADHDSILGVGVVAMPGTCVTARTTVYGPTAIKGVV
tara:strand:- start:323 stop:868 length:546 start_codon:yes stop_codon:yes gene_type:complete